MKECDLFKGGQSFGILTVISPKQKIKPKTHLWHRPRLVNSRQLIVLRIFTADNYNNCQ